MSKVGRLDTALIRKGALMASVLSKVVTEVGKREATDSLGPMWVMPHGSNQRIPPPSFESVDYSGLAAAPVASMRLTWCQAMRNVFAKKNPRAHFSMLRLRSLGIKHQT